MFQFGKFIIVCGHYGCGKTNFSMNLAFALAKQGRAVTLVDLDLVNPYFRSSDYPELLERNGVALIAPVFAHSNLDVPALPASLDSVFYTRDRTVIIDVGGDDAGATALGRYAQKIRELPAYEMLYLVNRYRALTTRAEQAEQLLGEIETASRLKATGVVNNSHLQQATTAQTILDSMEYAQQIAGQLALPLVLTTAPRPLTEELSGQIENLYPVDIYVKPPW